MFAPGETPVAITLPTYITRLLLPPRVKMLVLYLIQRDSVPVAAGQRLDFANVADFTNTTVSETNQVSNFEF